MIQTSSTNLVPNITYLTIFVTIKSEAGPGSQLLLKISYSGFVIKTFAKKFLSFA